MGLGYYRVMGKIFRIRCVARSVDEANQFCVDHEDCGVIDSDDHSRIIIAELKEDKCLSSK